MGLFPYIGFSPQNRLVLEKTKKPVWRGTQTGISIRNNNPITPFPSFYSIVNAKCFSGGKPVEMEQGLYLICVIFTRFAFSSRVCFLFLYWQCWRRPSRGPGGVKGPAHVFECQINHGCSKQC
jgi:hypothetical protein